MDFPAKVNQFSIFRKDLRSNDGRTKFPLYLRRQIKHDFLDSNGAWADR